MNVTGINFSEITWDMGDGESYENAQVQHIYSLPGEYEVTLLVQHEVCDITAEFNFLVDVNSITIDVPTLRFPNIITPNDDGKNDIFCPLGTIDILNFAESNLQDAFSFYSLQVFNRWGAQVFSSSLSQWCWDGTIDREPAEPGTYFWTCSYRRKCGDDNFLLLEGEVTVIKD